MVVEIDNKSGFCFGVVKAISAAEDALKEQATVFSLGDIVHNRVEVQRLLDLGLHPVTREDLPSLTGNTLLIRAHGEPPVTYQTTEKYDIHLIDATCPVVARLQKLVVEAHQKMQEVDGQVVILGKRGHAEVVGLAGQVNGDVIVIESEKDLTQIDFSRPIYLLSQTTQSLALFEDIRDAILKQAVDPDRVIIHDTICRQVSNRDPHLREFARRFDVIVFVSGKKSSNGKVLFNVCKAVNPRSYNIEEASEIDPEWFKGVASVGVCGATSTPKWLMEEIAEHIKSFR